MKIQIQGILPRRQPFARAFTLIELLVVIAIIAMLAALSIGAFTMAMQTAARNRTTATLQAIVSALERYKADNGEFPEPTSVGAHSLTNTSGAQMLYQAITGDGTDQIKLTTGGGVSSSGLVPAANSQYTINGDFIPSKSTQDASGTWKSKLNATMVDASNRFYLMDGFGHPFQYDKAAATGQPPTTVNPTYDLWSYGNSNAGDSGQDAALNIKQDPVATGIWIKNW